MVDLVAGISAHFESTSDSVRLLGQIVAECVLGKLNVKQGKSLKMVGSHYLSHNLVVYTNRYLFFEIGHLPDF